MKAILITLSLFGLTRYGLLTKTKATYTGNWTTASYFELKEKGNTLRLFFRDTLGEERVFRIDTVGRGK